MSSVRRLDTSLAGVAYGATSVALFSAFTLVSRIGLTSSVRPWDLMALRFGIGGLLLLPVLARHGLAKVAPRDALALAFFGGLGFASCAYAGFALAPAAHGAVLLHGTLPLSTYIVAGAMRQSSNRPSIAGLLLIALGIVAMAAESGLHSTPLQLIGDGALLLASFSWSAYGLLARRIGLAPEHSASIVAVVSMCAYLPLVLIMLPGGHWLSAGWRDLLLQAVFQGLLVGAVSIFVYSKTIVILGTTKTAVLTAAVPCITTLLAIPLLHESPSLFVLSGIALITTGMVVSLQPRRARSSTRWR
jgi:drug/metabolite transporter (DMT)-like permease